jgi:hypothetical protein
MTNKESQKGKEQKPPKQKEERGDLRGFTKFLNSGNLDQFFFDKLSKVSAKHRGMIFETLDEFNRNRNLNFTCIYPAPGCSSYDKYFQGPRPSN